ncbi:MAG TPA: hypothetical protein DCS12_01205 [Clostridiales bacterium]|nr:hypothetical protein [Clostridiales bacterium]
MSIQEELKGYPSIDKLWLKYYSNEQKNTTKKYHFIHKYFCLSYIALKAFIITNGNYQIYKLKKT